MSITVAIVGSNDRARLALVEALHAAPVDWILRLHREPPTDADVIVCDPALVIDDAIVFSDPSEDLVARIRERTARRRKTILVSSPSGGTGATSVALHLAAELAVLGHRTAFVDMNPDWGVRGRLGLDASDGSELPVPLAGGYRLMSATGDFGSFDRVVVEAPRCSIGEAGPIDVALLICSPTPEGARRARRVLDEYPVLDWHVVINRTGPGGETTRAQIERALGLPVVELPSCAALRDAEDDCRLLARGWTRWSRAISRLVAQLDAV